MPISDLLASISGGEATTSTSPSTSPSTTLSRTNTLPKRKASEDIDNVSKTPRTTLSSTVAPRLPAPLPRSRNGETSSPQPKSTLPSRPLDRPRAAPKPYTGTSSKPSVLSARPMNGGNRVTKPAPPSRPSPAPSRAVTAAPSAASRVPPKKGSFAEILARGKLAQASMGQVGKIQHKKVEKGSAPRAKEEPARADPRNPVRKPGGPAAAAGPAYSGTSKLGTRNGPPGQRPRNSTSAHTPPLRNGTNGSAKDGRNGKPATLTKAERAKLQAEEEREKRLKKAAEVTSGYAGTARPKPGNPVKKRDAPRGGALLNTRAPRPAASRSRLEDEYDEELDDFIEYDDDEDDGYGRRYDYASDGSSDMEAGMDDIDDEELRAERIARQEDIAEERLERNLKAAKEERKRQALESIRAGAGRRR